MGGNQSVPEKSIHEFTVKVIFCFVLFNSIPFHSITKTESFSENSGFFFFFPMVVGIGAGC